MKYTSIFYKLRRKLPGQMLREIYYAFIHSYVLYGVEIYANTKPTYLDKLMTNDYSYTWAFKTYNTLLITDLHKQQLLFLFISLFTILNWYLKYLSIILHF